LTPENDPIVTDDSILIWLCPGSKPGILFGWPEPASWVIDSAAAVSPRQCETRLQMTANGVDDLTTIMPVNEVDQGALNQHGADEALGPGDDVQFSDEIWMSADRDALGSLVGFVADRPAAFALSRFDRLNHYHSESLIFDGIEC
jgi:hypothetical protein